MDENFPNYKIVLDPGFWLKYEFNMNTHFWPQLRRLNVNLHIVGKLIAFPFELFADGGKAETPFFNAVLANFLEMSTLVFTRLLLDESITGTYRLDSFQGDLMK